MDDTQGGSGDRLSVESLPLIDTRLLSQAELCALSHCFSRSPSFSSALGASAGVDDDLTLNLDRTVFNESAGSRKQTFHRLRLARHPQPPEPPSPQRRGDDSSREEKLQVASLLRSLFSIDSFQIKREEEEEGDEENEGQQKFSLPIDFETNLYQNPNLGSIQNAQGQMASVDETRRRQERPERGGHLFVDKSNRNLGTESRYGALGIFMDSDSGKKKRGRPRKNRDGLDQSVLDCNLENKDGTMVDLFALSNAEDPYQEELRRITMGLKTKEDFLGFLGQLGGEWVNNGKKKKVVEASDYGGCLPRGWKLMFFIKKKDGNLWLACHKYISPSGKEFATCKEVSAYLHSLLESHNNKPLIALQSEDKTSGPPVMAANASLPGNHDAMDLPVLGSETNQNLESGRHSSGVFEEMKGAEMGDISDPVNSSLVEIDDGVVNRNSSNTIELVDKEFPAADLANRVGDSTGESDSR